MQHQRHYIFYTNPLTLTLFSENHPFNTMLLYSVTRATRSGEKILHIETIITKGSKFSPLQAGSRIGLGSTAESVKSKRGSGDTPTRRA